MNIILGAAWCSHSKGQRFGGRRAFDCNSGRSLRDLPNRQSASSPPKHGTHPTDMLCVEGDTFS